MALRFKDRLSYNSGMAPQINSFRELIELWETREAMAADIGAKASAVSKWWQRNSVPAEWWSPILATEVAFKSKIRAETLIELAARSSEIVS
jgi:hypothetical protein